MSASTCALPFLTGRIVDAVTVHGAAAELRQYMIVYAADHRRVLHVHLQFIAVAGRITVVDQLRHPPDLFRQAPAAAVFVLRPQGGGLADGANDQRLLEPLARDGLVDARSGLGSMRAGPARSC